MHHRTSTSLTLDYDQKAKLLRHGIWSYDLFSKSDISEICNDLEIPQILELEPLKISYRNIDSDYYCGISSIDSLISSYLGGCVSEICGMPGSGRTTFCLRYAQVLMKKNECTLWIDTEGCLVPPSGLTLKTIRIHDHLQFFALTYKLRSIVNMINPKLIVVDSIAGTMRGEASNESNRTALLWEFVNALKKIAAETGCAIFITNHLSYMQFHGMIRTLGQSLANAPTHCFEIKKSGLGSRTLRILKSPCLPKIDIELSDNVSFEY